MKPQTSPLDGSEWSLLREQVAKIQALVTRRYGATPFDQSLDDLEPLQRLVDDRAFEEDHADEWRALGSVFGNVVAKQLGFEWVADGEGNAREPALRLKPNGALVIHPLRMMQRRAASGARVELAALVA